MSGNPADRREALPDLWKEGEPDARRLYQLFLAYLMRDERHDRIVEVCRIIRRNVARGPGRRDGLFTYPIELESLCALGRFEPAWRQLRRWEETEFGRRLDIRRHRWTREQGHILLYQYAPLMYYRQRYHLGRRLQETGLRFAFQERHLNSYEILFHVYNDDPEPSQCPRVTLIHFYRRLDRSLDQWENWVRFIDGFHPRLLRIAEIRREDLRSDVSLLPLLYRRLLEISAARITSGVTRGQNDLIQSEAKVRRWQEETAEKIRQHDREFRSQRRTIRENLVSWFPELRRVPHRDDE